MRCRTIDEQWGVDCTQRVNDVTDMSSHFPYVRPEQSSGGDFVLGVNSLNAFQIFKFIFLLRVLRNCSGYASQRIAALGAVNGVDATSIAFSLRMLFRDKPIALLTCTIAVTVTLTSTALLFIERPAPDSYVINGGDAFWLTIITISTIGYGDLWVATHWGRLVVVIGGIGFGTVVITMMTAIFITLTNLSHREQRFTRIVQWQRWRLRFDTAFATAFQRALRLHWEEARRYAKPTACARCVSCNGVLGACCPALGLAQLAGRAGAAARSRGRQDLMWATQRLKQVRTFAPDKTTIETMPTDLLELSSQLESLQARCNRIVAAVQAMPGSARVFVNAEEDRLRCAEGGDGGNAAAAERREVLDDLRSLANGDSSRARTTVLGDMLRQTFLERENEYGRHLRCVAPRCALHRACALCT